MNPGEPLDPSPKKALTMRDLARAAGISTFSVSRALSGGRGVSPKTRDHIRALSKSLGYVPAMAASALRGRRPPLVGVFSPFENSWPTVQVLWGISLGLRERGLHMQLFPAPGDPKRMRRWLQEGLEQGLLGSLIAVSNGDLAPADLEMARRRGLPVVTVEFRQAGCFSVEVDDRLGGRLAARHLAGRASLYMAVGALSQGEPGRKRITAFRAELRNRGVPAAKIRTLFLEETSFLSGGKLGLKLRLAAKGPVAVFSVWGDPFAAGLVRALVQRGLVPLRDFRVLGYDDIEMASYSTPGLTTIHQPLDQMGREAARMAASAYRDPSLRPKNVVLKPSLVVRESG